MFAYIEGTLTSSSADTAVVDVQGIGYELHIPISTLEALPEHGNRVKLLTHFLVREDAQLLYGFASEDERALFRLVMKVRGFGAKAAMAVLSTLSPQEFVTMVVAGDTSSLTKIPGIGARSAERLVVELRGSLESFETMTSDQAKVTDAISDAESALAGLGYKPAEIRKALGQIDSDQDISNIIRQALQQLSRNQA